jgi:hypothetical protein
VDGWARRRGRRHNRRMFNMLRRRLGFSALRLTTVHFASDSKRVHTSVNAARTSAGATAGSYNGVVIAVEVPVGFTSVTVTDVIDCTLPVTVNGRVKLNWLPNAADAEL